MNKIKGLPQTTEELKQHLVELVQPDGTQKPKINLGKAVWLLAFADDGVIWGRVEKGQLVLSEQAYLKYSAKFEVETLQQAFLFGENGEVHIWRDGSSLKAWSYEDQGDEESSAFDRHYFLWGLYAREMNPEFQFSLVADGSRELIHAVPFLVAPSRMAETGEKHFLRLTLRNYIDYRPTGQAYISASRLVNVYEE